MNALVQHYHRSSITAKLAFAAFPDAALLRRHAAADPASFSDLLAAAETVLQAGGQAVALCPSYGIDSRTEVGLEGNNPGE